MPPLLAKGKDSPSRATGLGAAFALTGVGLVPVPFLVSRRVRRKIPPWCFRYVSIETAFLFYGWLSNRVHQAMSHFQSGGGLEHVY